LQYIEQVAQLGSIQAASREYGIFASAIHRQIKSVEDALGEMLFERDAKGMTLTPAGRLKFDPISDKDTFRQTISLISNKQIPESTTTQKIIAIAVLLLECLTGLADFEH
jgi:hypothetical protein